MTDTDKAQIAALGSTRIGTLDDYRRMWTGQREAKGLPAGREDWEAWLVDRLLTDGVKIAQAVEVLKRAQRILGRLAYPRANDDVTHAWAEVVAVETAIRATLVAIKGGDNE